MAIGEMIGRFLSLGTIQRHRYPRTRERLGEGGIMAALQHHIHRATLAAYQGLLVKEFQLIWLMHTDLIVRSPTINHEFKSVDSQQAFFFVNVSTCRGE